MKKILLALVVCAGMCACNSEEVLLSNPTTPIVEGEGYVCFAINLPTTSATRAANDVYNDGLTSEYAVKDATLLLFAGSSEAAAKYYESYNLTTDWQLYESSTDNITSRSLLTQLIGTPVEGDIYALVVLNENGLLKYITEGATLSDLQTTALELGGVSAMTADGLFMCNAPLSLLPGGTSAATAPSGSEITTLTKIDASRIFTSAAEAASHPATEIYVERGMAKVTVLDNAGASIVGTDIPLSLEGFVLDLTNEVSYLVRNTTSSAEWLGYTSGQATNYRMVGDVQVASGLYRTYWAADPNYDAYPYVETDGVKTYSQMNYLAGTAPLLGSIGEDNPQYCLDNTTTVRHMNADETTRAIIAAELYNGADFFVFDNNKTTVYTDLDDVKALLLAQLHAEGYMEEAEALWVGPEPGASNLYEYISIVFDDESNLAASDDLTFTYDISEKVIAEWFVDQDDRSQQASEIPGALVAGSAEHTAVVEDLNLHHQVAYYGGGISYYPVTIEHFGDELTPWDESYASSVGTANEESYPEGQWGKTAEQNWLGRYGVLRNNWYEINVTGVNKIGSATVPEAYGEPNDPVEKWLNIEINILSWAKRTQDVTL